MHLRLLYLLQIKHVIIIYFFLIFFICSFRLIQNKPIIVIAFN